MYIKIGNYKDWFGPHQLAETLKVFGVSGDKRYKIGDFLAETPIMGLCRWIDSKRTRKVKIRIDKYDTWSMDNTLALIILPMLKQLKATKHGAPCVDDNDVPWYLSGKFFDKENSWDVDPNHFKRWDWVLDEIIWVFEQLNKGGWDGVYHHGNIDFTYGPLENGFFFREKTIKDTHWFDSEGFTKHQTRINKALILFGKYYQNLWD